MKYPPFPFMEKALRAAEAVTNFQLVLNTVLRGKYNRRKQKRNILAAALRLALDFESGHVFWRLVTYSYKPRWKRCSYS